MRPRSGQRIGNGFRLKTTTEKLGNGLAKMRVELDPAELQSEYARAVKRISGKARIPGFRPGKAPRGIVESMFGKQAIISEALERLVPDAYDRAIREESLEPIDQPELDLDTEVDVDSPVVFTATIPLRPTVVLGDVESISLTRDRVEVEESDVDEVLKDVRRTRMELKSVEGRPIEDGDVAEMRISMIADEVDHSRDDPYSFIVGESWLPAGFDAKTTGMEIGDVRVFDLDVPDDYHDDALRGKLATFTAELLSIRTSELPELTDELAASVSDFETADELRQDVEGRVLERKTQSTEMELRNAALETLVARSRFEIPDMLIQRRADEIIEGRTNFVTSRGVAIETYLASVDKSQEEWRAEAVEEATADVRRTVALTAFGEEQSVRVEESEFEEELEALVSQYPEDERGRARRAHQSGDLRNRLEGRIRDSKGLDSLMEAIEIIEAEPAEKDEAESRGEASSVAEETGESNDAENPLAESPEA